MTKTYRYIFRYVKLLSCMAIVGHEEKYLESPNSSVSSCGEACENTFVNGKEDSGGHQRKRSKYGSIFRKRKGSYKPKYASIFFLFQTI